MVLILPKAENIVYGYCGVTCSFCRAFRKGLCKGCDEHKDTCEYARCCITRGIESCLQCSEFPCKTHRDGFDIEIEGAGRIRWRVYSEVFMEMFKRI